MAYSVTVAALLHPWSGRLELVCSLPFYRENATSSDTTTPKNDIYPIPIQTHERRQKRLSTELPWLFSVTRDEAAEEITEEEDTISTIEARSEALSSEETTCEDRDKMSETLETTATGVELLQEETLLGALVDLTIPQTSKAEEKPKTEGEPETRFMLPLTRKLSPSPEYRNEYFQVAKSRVAGWGAFATRDLRQGDVILREIPLFVAESHNIIREFYKLSVQDREVALSLHAHELIKGDTPKITAIWHTNCFAVEHYVAGLFPIAARFNHACFPVNNVEYRFDEGTRALEMVVRRDVAAGRELKISYGKNLSPELLYSCYGFRCGCGGCEGLSERDVELFEDMQWYS